MENSHPTPWYAGEGYDQYDPGLYIAASNGTIVIADTEGTLTRETRDLIIRLRNDNARLTAELGEAKAWRERLDDLLVKAYQQ